jgi:hypothetical protein
MKVWLVSFGFLFVLVELFQWLKGVTPPLPVYVFAGAFLAIASNYEKGITSFWSRQSSIEGDLISENATLIDETSALSAKTLDRPSLAADSSIDRE